MDSANQGNNWENERLLNSGKDKEKDKVFIECRICEFFIDDKEHYPRFFCTFEGESELIEFCEEFNLGKWALAEFLKEKFGGNNHGD